MNIAAAFHCYEVARNANNREAALRHLHRIRDELKSRSTNKNQISNCTKTPTFADANDRVCSIFDHE